MTALKVGHFADSGVGHVPKRHKYWVCRSDPKRRTSCGLTASWGPASGGCDVLQTHWLRWHAIAPITATNCHVSRRRPNWLSGPLLVESGV